MAVADDVTEPPAAVNRTVTVEIVLPKDMVYVVGATAVNTEPVNVAASVETGMLMSTFLLSVEPWLDSVALVVVIVLVCSSEPVRLNDAAVMPMVERMLVKLNVFDTSVAPELNSPNAFEPDDVATAVPAKLTASVLNVVAGPATETTVAAPADATLSVPARFTDSALNVVPLPDTNTPMACPAAVTLIVVAERVSEEVVDAPRSCMP